MSYLLWQKAEVSTDGTHHVENGRSLYDVRFLRVMSFHEPGLAAVRSERGAGHIDVSGNYAYSKIFVKTFGFYGSMASVESEQGCFHITPDGSPVYAASYRWCGNFQGGRSVVCSDNGYFHVLPDGSPLYDRCFAYAGDFRERRAVVRLSDDGLCAHIDENGMFAHSFRYYDAGVYHKGFACARDEHGWMHIDFEGIPAYERRFALLEPFYNECALAKTFDGKIVTIDECGRDVNLVADACDAGMAGATKRDLFQEMSSDMTGYWKTHALSAAVKLRAAEKFPVRDDNAGDALMLPSGNARIFLRALGEIGVAQRRGDMWELTEKGKLLLPEHPHSMFYAAMMWSEFSKTGDDSVLRGLSGCGKSDIFSEISSDKEKVKLMHSMLSSYARHDYQLLPEALPMDGVECLIDAGGGSGVAAELITEVHKNTRVIVMDKPEVLDFACFERSNFRIAAYSADIFAPWNIGGDAVLLCRVLHDWDDDRVLRILKNACAAVCSGGKIFVVERVIFAEEEHGLCSLHLLAISGGRERTANEYKSLLASAGINFLGVRSLSGGICLITGEVS